MSSREAVSDGSNSGVGADDAGSRNSSTRAEQGEIGAVEESTEPKDSLEEELAAEETLPTADAPRPQPGRPIRTEEQRAQEEVERLRELRHREFWQSRFWVRGDRVQRVNHDNTVTVLSYNVQADSKVHTLTWVRSSVASWPLRSEVLFKEILSYAATIVCLQDVDHYREFWQPRFSSAGYNTVYKQCTSEKSMRQEGVLIAFRSDHYQMFNFVEVELNEATAEAKDPNLVTRMLQDNVGLIVQLQPWRDSNMCSALTIANMQLCSNRAFEDVRLLQGRYFLHQLQHVNAAYQLPCVVCGGLESVPTSLVYEVFATGRMPFDPGAPQAPGKPRVIPLSRGSVRVEWSEAPINFEALDPLVSGYYIAWRPGGNMTLGFRDELFAHDSDCTTYEDVIGRDGKRRSEQVPYKVCIVTGLSSEVTYEFRICGVNEIGRGTWSEISDPVYMANPPKAPAHPPKAVLLDFPQVDEQRERFAMDQNDKHNVVLRERPVANLTPRSYSGQRAYVGAAVRVLPTTEDGEDDVTQPAAANQRGTAVANARLRQPALGTLREDEQSISEYSNMTPGAGLRLPLPGNAAAEEEALEEVLSEDSRSPPGSHAYGLGLRGSPLTPGAHGQQQQQRQQQQQHHPYGRGPVRAPQWPFPDEGGMSASFTTYTSSGVYHFEEPEEDEYVGDELQMSNTISERTPLAEQEGSATATKSRVRGGKTKSVFGPSGALGSFMYSSSTTVNGMLVKDIGTWNPRQEHLLSLRSAYREFLFDGEPTFTCAVDNFVGTLDYIFCSAECMRVISVMSMPSIWDIQGVDSREAHMEVDPTFGAPHAWRDGRNQITEIVEEDLQRQADVQARRGKESTHHLTPSDAALDKIEQIVLAGNFNGGWLPFGRPPSTTQCRWLPTLQYPSTHLAIMVELEIVPSKLSVMWHSQK